MAHPVKISLLVLVAALMSGGSGCAPAIHVHAIQSPDAHFERYRTIAFDVSRRAPAGHAALPRLADVRDHVRQLAAEILQSRGYRLAARDQADLVVRVEAGRREVEVPTGTGIHAARRWRPRFAGGVARKRHPGQRAGPRRHGDIGIPRRARPRGGRPRRGCIRDSRVRWGNPSTRLARLGSYRGQSRTGRLMGV